MPPRLTLDDVFAAFIITPAPSLSDVLVDGVASGTLVAIDYTDSDGVRSQRNILPHTIKRCQSGQTIIKAYDPQRQDHRSFRLDRIHSAARA